MTTEELTRYRQTAMEGARLSGIIEYHAQRFPKYIPTGTTTESSKPERVVITLTMGNFNAATRVWSAAKSTMRNMVAVIDEVERLRMELARRNRHDAMTNEEVERLAGEEVR